MSPRLAVTREQVDRWDELYDGAPADRPPRELRLRLPERPTMPCPCGGEAHPAHALHSTSFVPIPEGTRVRIEYPCPECLVGAFDARAMHDHRYGCQRCHGRTFVPVAFATLTKVKPVEGYWPDDDYWLIVLSDIEPVEAS